MTPREVVDDNPHGKTNLRRDILSEADHVAVTIRNISRKQRSGVGDNQSLSARVHPGNGSTDVLSQSAVENGTLQRACARR
jgi:hypothetical protein